MSQACLSATQQLTPDILNTPFDRTKHRPSITVLLLCSAASLLPFVLNYKEFSQLFWFGDEIHLLSEMSRAGYISWSLGTFAENSVPVFKLAWGGALFLFDGSYFAIITLVWCTHALNIFLLGILLARHGYPAWLSLPALLLFAWAPSFHETLGWSVQWSAVLVVTFFLAALLLAHDKPFTSKVNWLMVLLLSAGSAFSFSRGVVACSALAIYIWISHLSADYKATLLKMSAPVIPMLLATAIIFINSTGNHQQLASANSAALSQIWEFGLNFYFMNPIFRLFSDLPPTVSSLAMSGALKSLIIALAIAAICGKKIRPCPLFLALLAFDFANTLLVSVGRYHTGAQFAVSSRYQYEPFLCLIPALIITLRAASESGRISSKLKRGAIIMVSLCLGTYFLIKWQTVMKPWAQSRGLEGRQFYFAAPSQQQPQWWGLPSIVPKEEAYRVIKTYNLH